MVEGVFLGQDQLDIQFLYGMTVDREEMEESAIYLDGVVQGPVIDNERHSHSFDHHGDCLRMVTLATCQQVRLALELGFDATGFTVVLNDLDADASLALWLLRHPERAMEKRILEVVEQVGFVDAHGPVREPALLHHALTHGHDEEQSEEMLWADQELIDTWYDQGDQALPEPSSHIAAPAFGLTRAGELREFDATKSFADLYRRGIVVAVLCPQGPAGSIGYTIGKRSDFVAFDVEAFLSEINDLESGWGGASTIGGAPRCSDGRRSELSKEIVKKVFVDVAGKTS